MLTARKIEWAAGFLEGEGSFRLRRVRLRSPNGGATAEVSAVQKQREPLDRLQELFGGKIYWRPRNGRGIHGWYVSGSTAIGLMQTLYALMSPARRVQIRTAIDAWRARPGKGARNRLKTHCPKGHPYSESNTLVVKSPYGSRRARLCRECRA